jgi:hypothetical protein
MPDLAEKHLGGAGVVLIGIGQQQTVVGAEQVDGAVLRDAVEPYVGEDGPRWDYQFISHRDGLILAVIVDPPRWGDSIHACRKGLLRRRHETRGPGRGGSGSRARQDPPGDELRPVAVGAAPV